MSDQIHETRPPRSTRALWKRVALGAGRLILIIGLQAVALWLVAGILPGVSLSGAATPVAGSVVMLAVMLILWPLFIRFFFKLVVRTSAARSRI